MKVWLSKNCGKDIATLKYSQRKFCSTTCQQESWRLSNPGKAKAKREKENSNSPKRILSRVKSRAKLTGQYFNLDISDIVIPEFCPVLGIRLNPNPGKGSGYHNDSASVDRIDSSRGYEKGNIRVISNRANLLKNNATVEELEKVLNDLRSLQS